MSHISDYIAMSLMDRAQGTDGLLVAPSSGVRLAGVEGLRALAAGSIVIVHVWGFSSPNGVALGSGQGIGDALSSLSVGVTLFFTLSGFLLYRPFAASIARGTPRMPIRAYLHNRVLRIAPAYWVILLICALLLGSVNITGGSGVGRLTDPFALLQAGLLVHDYRPTTIGIGIGPAWSLAVEAVFYLALPLLVIGAARLARRTKDRSGRILVLLGPPVLLLLVGLTGKVAAAFLFPAAPTAGYGNNWHSVIERSFWAQADLFSFGMVVAVLYVEMSDGRIRLPTHWRRVAVGLGLLVFIPCAWTMHMGEQSYLPQNTGEALGIAMVFAAIVMPGPSTKGHSRAVRFLEAPVLVAVGVASYSVFLWHFPLIEWLTSHGLTVGGWGGLLVNTVVVAVIVGVLSALTYHFVERPALRRKRSTRVAAPAIIVSPRQAAEAPAAGGRARPQSRS
jgi:peptidoglycan/LPS O-acetylase OafA/YrhL